MWQFVATHVLSPVSPVSKTPGTSGAVGNRVPSLQTPAGPWSSYLVPTAPLPQKNVRPQRVEQLLWLTTATNSLIVHNFSDLNDPESCHIKRDHVPNTSLSSKLHSFLPIETKNTRNLDPSILLFTCSILQHEGCRQKDRTSCGIALIALHLTANRLAFRHHDLTTALRPSQQVVARPLGKGALKQTRQEPTWSSN